MSLDPGEEVGNFGEDSRLSLAGAGSPGNNSDNVELSGLGFGWADERAAGISHASRGVVGTESDHTRLNHIGPTGLQVGIGPDLALKLLELVGHVSWWSDKTPTGKPASLGAMVVFASVGHASGAGVRSREVNVFGQLDQSDVMLDGVGLVKFGVDDDLGNGDINFGAVIVSLVPFANANSEVGGSLRLSEAVSSAEDPARGDQSTSANMLFLEESEGGKSEGDLPRELAVSGGKPIDDAASGSLLAAGLEGGGASHDGDQHDQDLHLRCRAENYFVGKC